MEAKAKILGIIPARYGSTRFPGKPLAMINGKTMIQRVYDQAKKAKSLTDVIVATDSIEILNTLEGRACITREHPTGTDRCAEVLSYAKEKYDYIINIQGDQPYIQPEQIDLLATLCDGETEIGTLVKRIENLEEMKNPHIVKVIKHLNGEAATFSRHSINNLKHIGIYAYRSDILKKISTLPQSKFEISEGLEQIRWLENGLKIKCLETEFDSISVDTPEDILKLPRE